MDWAQTSQQQADQVSSYKINSLNYNQRRNKQKEIDAHNTWLAMALVLAKPTNTYYQDMQDEKKNQKLKKMISRGHDRTKVTSFMDINNNNLNTTQYSNSVCGDNTSFRQSKVSQYGNNHYPSKKLRYKLKTNHQSTSKDTITTIHKNQMKDIITETGQSSRGNGSNVQSKSQKQFYGTQTYFGER